MKFKNKFGTINVLPKEKMVRNKTIALSMSGGLDSTMLCILLAKTIQERNLNTDIQPFNGLDLFAPLDSSGLVYIIEEIRQMFPNVGIKWPVSVVFDTKGDHIKDKNTYIQPFVNSLLKKRYIDVIISGISMGPPLEVQQSFGIKDHTAIQRIPGYRLYNEVEQTNPITGPYRDIDKRFILQCYKDFGLEHLIDMTESCTHPIGKCGRCWWCKEREWAIKEVFGNGND